MMAMAMAMTVAIALKIGYVVISFTVAITKEMHAEMWPLILNVRKKNTFGDINENYMSPHFGHVVINLDVSNALLIDINVAQVPNMADLVMMVMIMKKMVSGIMTNMPNIMMLTVSFGSLWSH